MSIGLYLTQYNMVRYGSVRVRHGSVRVRHGSVRVRHGSVRVRHGSVRVRHGSVRVRHGLVRVRHGSVRVRHGSVGSVSGCCKAAPSSNLGSAPQWRPSTWACSDEETGAELSECCELMRMNEFVWMYSKWWRKLIKSGFVPPKPLMLNTYSKHCMVTGKINIS